MWKATRIDAVKVEHIFSKKHMKKGIMDLGDSPSKIIVAVSNRLLELDVAGQLKEGQNVIHTTINGHRATIRANFENRHYWN